MKSRNKVVAEYSVRNMNRAIGLAEYKLEKALPDEIRSNLPSVEELESELSKKL